MSEGTLDEKELPVILRRLEADRQFWAAMSVTGDVLTTTETLVGSHPLRTLDALHVGSAQLFARRIADPTLTFVSADERQTVAAGTLGLTVVLIRSADRQRSSTARGS